MSKKSAPTSSSDEPGEKSPKKSRRKLILVVAVVLVVAGAGAYVFLGRDSGPKAPVAGEVLLLEPIQINLADNHYLRVKLALQLTEEAVEVDGSKALDAAITLFSGRPVEKLLAKGERANLKSELAAELKETYEGEVMDVYFAEFVTQ
ncbi:flagellar basal body-associated FliL family protein [Nocardioides caricicola]|uniref:Flagellar protein FliL n=1 Tax=Nocardioides caricicola TaxID=634770 RepID=A0ABW0N1X6_9ACTN